MAWMAANEPLAMLHSAVHGRYRGFGWTIYRSIDRSIEMEIEIIDG